MKALSWPVINRYYSKNFVFISCMCADSPSKQHSACSVKKDFIASNWPAELKVLSDLISNACYNVCLHPELLPSVIIKLNEN